MTFIPVVMLANGGILALSIIVVALVILFISRVRIVPQGKAVVVQRVGRYYKTWETGFHILCPFIDSVAKNIVLMEQVVDFPPQPVITKDNVKMQIDTVVFYQITDCKLFAYGHANPMFALENLTATTLRNIIGEMELDSTLTSRDVINTNMRSVLDEATDPWGIKVNRVELKNIMPPREIQDAMEKQMKAERERREAILRAEGEKKSAILLQKDVKNRLYLMLKQQSRLKFFEQKQSKRQKSARQRVRLRQFSKFSKQPLTVSE